MRLRPSLNLRGRKQKVSSSTPSAQSPPLIRAHFCGSHCDQKRSNPDLVHLKSFRKLEDAAEKTWETNLIVVDENAPLRRAQAEWQIERGDAKVAPQEVASSEASQGKKKKKKKKKSQKEGLQPEKNQEVRGQVCGNEAPEGSLQRHGFRSGAPYPQEGEKACEKEVEAIQRFVQHELVRDKFNVRSGRGGRDFGGPVQDPEDRNDRAGGADRGGTPEHEAICASDRGVYVGDGRGFTTPGDDAICQDAPGPASIRWPPERGFDPVLHRGLAPARASNGSPRHHYPSA